MLKILESIDLPTEIGLNNIYYLFNEYSFPTNLELLSKIKTFSNTYDFFHHYTSKDINIISNLCSKLEDNYLNICNNDNYLNFNQNNEKYISIFSNFILLFNLIIKNINIIKSVSFRIKNNLKKYYSENIIDDDFKDKINKFVNNLLKLSFNDELNKKNSKNSSFKNNISLTNITDSTDNSITKDKNNNEKTLNDDLYSMNNEDNLITPYFASKGEKDKSQLSLININNDISNNNNIIKLRNSNKKDSIGSIFNLPCVNPNNVKNEKSNIKEKETLLLSLEDKKIEVKSIILNNIKVINNLNNITLNINNNKFIKDNNSDKIKLNNDSKMLSILLKTLSVLYKKRYINSPQKVKLKKLIISKSPKERILFYNYMNNNIKAFIKEIGNI